MLINKMAMYLYNISSKNIYLEHFFNVSAHHDANTYPVYCLEFLLFQETLTSKLL